MCNGEPRRLRVNWSGLVWIGFALVLAGCSPFGKAGAPPRLSDIAESCGGANPFVAVSHFAFARSKTSAANEPALIGFDDRATAAISETLTLATQAQVGATFGLAFDGVHNQLYAAAYLKRATTFGPGGPGQIYQVDLATGAVKPFVKLQAGSDPHNLGQDDDAAVIDGIGKLGLGGLAVDDDGTLLWAMNLVDGRIYRIALSSGTVLGSFPHGATGTPWARYARPFAVAYRGGWVYHGLIDSQERANPVGPLWARVYRSRADGSEMSEVAALAMSYGRPFPWQRWEKPQILTPQRTPLAQPMLTAIAFRPNGDLVLGLRDRIIDMLPTILATNARYGTGDLVLMTQDGSGAYPQPGALEGFGDQTVYDEATFGGAASLPGLDMIVAPILAPLGDPELVGVYWYNTPTGSAGRIAGLARIATANGIGQAPVPGKKSNGLGGIVALCRQLDLATPEAAATASQIAATATEAAGATATAIGATATADAHATAVARATRRAMQPVIIQQGCGTDNPYFAITCFAQYANSPDEAAIVAFNDTTSEDPNDHFMLANQQQVGATYGLAYDWRRRQIYAAAYHKRGAVMGPGGPGQIYRVDLDSGNVVPWVKLEAGPDRHGGANFDETAAEWVGKSAFGDIELSEDGQTLFVMNLGDRRIYRLAVPDGTVLGSFPNGANDEPWSADARPFALGVRDGWLYHGVVNSCESGCKGAGIVVGVLYKSRPDGSEMTKVSEFDFGYGHNPIWQAWQTTPIFANPPSAQPMFTDIEFRPDGEPIVGLRDRQADMSVYIGFGDLLPTSSIGGSTRVTTRPELYQDDWIHQESAWGSMAAMPGQDVVVSSALAPNDPNTGGVAWFDNQNGKVVRRETIYYGLQMQASFNKSQGLGDLELLCPPLGAPTPEPSPTPTDTAVPTPTEPATPTPTFTPTAIPPTPTDLPTATPTGTPRPLEPIYVPLIQNEVCQSIHVEVVLILDVSTSMQRPTRNGRPKFAAAIDAGKQFVALLNTVPDEKGFADLAAVVGFNRTAWTEAGLTHDVPALAAALDRLPLRSAEYTRLDLALQEGARAALGPGHRPENIPVIVLLTDGLPNQVPYAEDGTMETTILRAAAKAKAQGIQIYTVGVGAPDDIDPKLLQGVASHPANYAYAPDAEDLGQIYRGLAGQIRCAGGVIGRGFAAQGAKSAR